MASPMYVKWLLFDINRIEQAKQKYPYFSRFVYKYIMEKHPQWFNAVMNNECYFCGIKFENLYALKMHLSRTRCSMEFEKMVLEILYEWSKFEILCRRIKHRKKKDEKQTLLKMLEDSNTRLEDIYKFCRENS